MVLLIERPNFPAPLAADHDSISNLGKMVGNGYITYVHG